jgi:hypothetical protein
MFLFDESPKHAVRISDSRSHVEMNIDEDPGLEQLALIEGLETAIGFGSRDTSGGRAWD